MRNFRHVHPLTVEKGCFLQFPDDSLEDRRHVHDLSVLELGWEVDTVVLADIFDGLGRELLSLGTDTHGFEDVASACQITTEGPGRDSGEFCQLLFADKKMFVVIVDHISFN